MFLRATKRFKDGKVHLYWSMVENVRVGRRVFQRRALYLGELNDSQYAEWQRVVEALGDEGKVRQLKLFPEDRAPETDDAQVVRIRMDRLTVRNVRNWGEVWLSAELWDRFGLDGFWRARLPPSRKVTDWLAILKAIVMYRLTDPGSELAMHADWLANTAIRGAMKTLFATIDARIGRAKWRKAEPSKRTLPRDELVSRLAVAAIFATCEAQKRLLRGGAHGDCTQGRVAVARRRVRCNWRRMVRLTLRSYLKTHPR